MALTEFERETVINYSDGEDVAQIYTAQRTVLTKLRKNPSAELVEEGEFEGTPWAKFRFPVALLSFRAQQKKVLSDEQRKKMSDAIKARKPWEKRGNDAGTQEDDTSAD